MKPTLVTHQGFQGNITFLNCGSVTTTDDSTVVAIDGSHVMILPFRVTDPVDVAQRFADLLTDVTA